MPKLIPVACYRPKPGYEEALLFVKIPREVCAVPYGTGQSSRCIPRTIVLGYLQPSLRD
jgi:hypothetical protein